VEKGKRERERERARGEFPFCLSFLVCVFVVSQREGEKHIYSKREHTRHPPTKKAGRGHTKEKKEEEEEEEEERGG